MITDPVGNMLVIIKNGYMARKTNVVVPYSGHKLQIAKVLASKNFISSAGQENSKINIELAYDGKKPKMQQIKRVSKPGLRIYIKSKNIKKIKGGKGTSVISTPQGVVSSDVAKEKKLGGELVCIVW